MNNRTLRQLLVCCALVLAWPCHAAEPDLKYFGFYKTVSVDPNETLAAATAGFSNVAWIAGGRVEPPYNYQHYVDTVTRVNCLGMRAVVDVSDMFFENHDQQGVTVWNLRTDWQASWDQFAAAIAPVLENVVAFYIFDEPNQAGINDIYPPTGLSNLRTAISAIKSRFATPVAIIYSDGTAPTPQAAANLPAIHDVDWVGLDCYSLYPVTCGGGSGTPYSQVIQNLESALNPNQRVILIPQAFLPLDAGCSPDSNCEAQLVSVAQYMYDLAGQDSKVIGVFPFIFWDNPAGWRGFQTLSSTMPQLKSTVENIGSTISSSVATTACKKNGPLLSPVLSTLLND